MYIKMSKTLSAKYYQENKEGQQKKPGKDTKIFLKKKKKKSNNMVVTVTKNLSEDKKQKLVECRKKILWNQKKRFIIIIKNHINLKEPCFFIRKIIKSFWFLSFANYLHKYKKVFRVSVSWSRRIFFGVSVSWSIKNLPGVDYFYFWGLGWEVLGSISGNIRKAFLGENARKAFFWENIRFFLILEL